MHLTLEHSGFLWHKLDYGQMNDRLNQLGQSGWEVVNALDVNYGHGSTSYIVYVLKRELPQKTDTEPRGCASKQHNPMPQKQQQDDCLPPIV